MVFYLFTFVVFLCNPWSDPTDARMQAEDLEVAQANIHTLHQRTLPSMRQ